MPGRRGRSGGYRQPSTPAAVSGPGSESARTDGTTPRVDLTGLDAQSHGQRSELEAVAGSTGGPGGPPAPAPSSASSSGPSPVSDADPTLSMDVFRPSDYPGLPTVPSSPFYDMAAQSVPDDPDALLRALYETSRHPDILRMMSMRRGMV